MDPRTFDPQYHHGRSGRGRGGATRGRGEGGFGRRGGRGGPFGGFGSGFGFDPEMFGRGPRRGRGDVRTAVLMLLLERPMHGYEMIQEIRSRSNDTWSPSPGAIYPTLQLLTDEGLIVNEDVDGKKVSKLTTSGQAAAEGLTESRSAPWEDASAASGGVTSLRESVVHLLHAVKQVGQTGSDTQRAKVKEMLDDTRKKVYGLLASDD